MISGRQGQLAVRGHQGQWDPQESKGKKGSLASHVQLRPSLRMGTATWWPCLALLEKRESLGLRASACQENRAGLESVDSRGRRVTQEILEILERQAPRGSRDCRESQGFGAPWGQKEKRAMAALPAPACRGR